jgi:hypothetical protein
MMWIDVEYRMKRFLALLILSLILGGCFGGPLVTKIMKDPPIGDERIYTLIYFVGVDRNDIKRAVILDLEGDKYNFSPRLRDFEYEILQNVTINEAIYESELFYRYEEVITGYLFVELFTTSGDMIGYELRPLYIKQIYGQEDILDVSYLHSGSKVKVTLGLQEGLITRITH